MDDLASFRFGALPLGDATRFGLWAPGCREAGLEIVGAQGEVLASHCLQPAPGGWHQATVAGAGHGTRYRFRVREDLAVPDPASRFNPLGVHGPSEVVDPGHHAWRHPDWAGRPWHEAVVYELHVGTFTPDGTLAAAAARLPALQALGITAVELMPLAAFPGRRGWGYDGVLPFAVHAPYGTPEDLKAFVDTAHGLGLMVLLDVVYNHFGPDGNYLGVYCPPFVNPAHHTPWGAAINLDGPQCEAVRRYFVENALYWVQTCRLDGLRLDAVHALFDGSATHLVEEIAAALRDGPGRERHVHLVLENERNAARLLARDRAAGGGAGLAQWNDDWHHAAHVVASGETDGYYADYADEPVAQLARALAEGFIYQGQPSAFAGGAARGEPSAHLPPTAFVAFLQNHDQIGNRALGQRLDAVAPAARVEALLGCLLLSPQVPMLFMGEEFAATSPFLYFCDHEGALAQAVTSGRREEFARFAAFADPAARQAIPDPNAAATFSESTLRWAEGHRAAGQHRLAFVTRLLALRREHLLPLLPQMHRGGRWQAQGEGLSVAWAAADGTCWRLRAHFGDGAGEWPVGAHEHAVFELAATLGDGRCRFHGPGVLATLEPAVRAAGE
ncbi:malto-oligosyltrehalose trehalohydrolase [Aquincola sp. MAHUQ-54]|uniref:Malto-oligosyltrehalose trehalohydrolase n=1 Tax=Aquincola agrisoli TaxID=3119538 RepID=A0AAW9Q4F4_9BURK